MGLYRLAIAQAAGGYLTLWGASLQLAKHPLTNSYGDRAAFAHRVDERLRLVYLLQGHHLD